MPTAITRRHALQTAAAATAAAAVAALPARPANAAPPRAHGKADLIIHNARVQIMDDAGRTAQAVAVRDGHILAVGANRDLLHLAGVRTETINAHGATVLPGVNDAHCHLSEYGLTFLTVDVDTATLDELINRVAEAAERTPAGQWIRGGGWSELRLPRPPTRHDLDPVTGDRPTILIDFTLHTATLNSAGLRAAGISATTPAPDGGVIERDPDGQPNGILREGAQQLAQQALPAYTDAQMQDAIRQASTALLARGITSVTEPGISPHLADLYTALATEGDLPLRVTALLRAGDSPETMRHALAELRHRRGRGRQFRLTGVKIFSDGVPTPARTAWMHQPYLDGTNGSLTIAGASPQERSSNLTTMVRLAHLAGVQIGAHACGDAAIDAVISAYTAALAARPRAHRHYLIHGDFVSAQTLAVMARHRIGVSMNAEIKHMIGNVLEPLLGPARTRHHWPYRTALHAGVQVTSGSDAPVTDPNWLSGLAAMVARISADGDVSGPDQRISLDAALRTYTRTPAWQDGCPTWKGTLQPAMAADLCVLDTDLHRADPREYGNAAVTATVIGGKIMCSGSSSRPAAARLAAGYLKHGCCTHSLPVAAA